MNSLGTACASQESPTNGQKRAKKGGETGPNGEWYPPGAFIATKDLPKRTKDWISRLPLERPVVIELSSRSSAAKVTQRQVGLVSIAAAISEVFTYGEVVNEVYIGYLLPLEQSCQWTQHPHRAKPQVRPKNPQSLQERLLTHLSATWKQPTPACTGSLQ